MRAAIRFLMESRSTLTVCGEAVDGLDAVEQANALSPDLILLDLRMPKLNGAETASILKRTHPGIVIVLFTMYEEAVHTLGRALGVDIVLAKPDGLNNLLQRVQDLLTERSKKEPPTLRN